MSSHGLIRLGSLIKLMLAIVHCFLEAYQFIVSAAPLVLIMDIEGHPFVAQPAFLQAVLAHLLVRLHVCLDRGVLAVGEPAVDGEVKGVDGLLCHQASDSEIKVW